MRVLHVLEAVRGGTSRHLFDVVSNTEGFEHHVALPRSGRQESESGAEFDSAIVQALPGARAVVHDIDMRRAPLHPVNAAAVVRLRRLVRDLDVAVIHGHSAIGGALARLSAVRTGVPVIYTPNGLPVGRASIAAERLLGRLTSTLVATSESEGKRAIELGLVDPERVVVVPNGIDLTRPTTPTPDLRRLAGVPDGAPLVGTVARLVPQKAPGFFVQVCEEVGRRRPDVHFVLIGLGPLQPEVDKLVELAALGPRWHQIRRLENAAGALGQLDVFVLASAFEGGPYTPLEAMRAGTPVVLSDVVGNRDAVEPGVSGLISPFGDTVTMAGTIVSLLGDEIQRKAMVDSARRRLEERFDVRTMGKALGNLYRARRN